MYQSSRRKTEDNDDVQVPTRARRLRALRLSASRDSGASSFDSSERNARVKETAPLTTRSEDDPIPANTTNASRSRGGGGGGSHCYRKSPEPVDTESLDNFMSMHHGDDDDSADIDFAHRSVHKPGGRRRIQAEVLDNVTSMHGGADDDDVVLRSSGRRRIKAEVLDNVHSMHDGDDDDDHDEDDFFPRSSGRRKIKAEVLDNVNSIHGGADDDPDLRLSSRKVGIKSRTNSQLRASVNRSFEEKKNESSNERGLNDFIEIRHKLMDVLNDIDSLDATKKNRLRPVRSQVMEAFDGIGSSSDVQQIRRKLAQALRELDAL